MVGLHPEIRPMEHLLVGIGNVICQTSGQFWNPQYKRHMELQEHLYKEKSLRAGAAWSGDGESHPWP